MKKLQGVNVFGYFDERKREIDGFFTNSKKRFFGNRFADKATDDLERDFGF